MAKLIAFDVETPNHRNDRMSAIGITVIENGVITKSGGTLIDPEAPFDEFNMELTGITPAAVQGAMTFDRLWARIGDLFAENVLLAHNAPFDMRVLASCLRAYGLPCPKTLDYACTCSMARRFLPQMESHGLAAMCDRYRIELDHHKADSDARACAAIALRFMAEGRDLTPFYRKYDVRRMKTLPFE